MSTRSRRRRHRARPDPAAAARAYLLRLPAEDDLLAAAAEATEQVDARARVAELEREVRAL